MGAFSTRKGQFQTPAEGKGQMPYKLTAVICMCGKMVQYTIKTFKDRKVLGVEWG